MRLDFKMAEIYLWKPKDNMVGHLSMKCSNGTYVSFWPKNPCAKDPRHHKSPSAALTYEDDVKSEGRKQDEILTIPEFLLDCEKITEWWITQRPPSYMLLFNNCSHAVATGLKKGGLKFIAWAGGLFVHTPTGVVDFLKQKGLPQALHRYFSELPIGPVISGNPHNEVLGWVPKSGDKFGNVPNYPVIRPYFYQGDRICVISANYQGGTFPGSLNLNKMEALISYDGHGIKVDDYAVLNDPKRELSWVYWNGDVPVGAFIGGKDPNGDTYYVGRAWTWNGYFGDFGKIHPKYQTCYVAQRSPTGLNEVEHKKFYILVSK